MAKKPITTRQELADLGQEQTKLLSEKAQDLQKQLGSILKTAARFSPSKEIDAHRISSKFSEPKPTGPSLFEFSIGSI